MSIDDVLASGGGPTCIVCGKSVAGDRGYAEVKHGEEMVTVCCPLCLETFQREPMVYIARRDAQRLTRGNKPDTG